MACCTSKLQNCKRWWFASIASHYPQKEILKGVTRSLAGSRLNAGNVHYSSIYCYTRRSRIPSSMTWTGDICCSCPCRIHSHPLLKQRRDRKEGESGEGEPDNSWRGDRWFTYGYRTNSSFNPGTCTRMNGRCLRYQPELIQDWLWATASPNTSYLLFELFYCPGRTYLVLKRPLLGWVIP